MPEAEPGSSEAEIRAVQATYDAWIEDYEGKGPDGYAAHFAENGALLPPKQAPVLGKERIRAWVEDFTEKLTLEVAELTWDEVKVSGDLGFARYHGNGKYIFRTGGEEIAFDQKYLDVLQKRPDGSWEIVYHSWTSSNYDPSVWDKQWNTE
jgi:uncharacterized protein (TIGR02246 family)